MSAPALPRTVVVRTLEPHDAAATVDAVFAGLSPSSRYLRFHSPVPRLTASLRDRLIDVDGRCRAAVVALAGDPLSPVGIARIAGAGSGRADLAVAVVDAWQRRGVGRKLLTAIADLAERIGYTELLGAVLPENVAMLSTARAVFPWSRSEFDGDVVQIGIPLGAAAWTVTDEDVLADLLRH